MNDTKMVSLLGSISEFVNILIFITGQRSPEFFWSACLEGAH